MTIWELLTALATKERDRTYYNARLWSLRIEGHKDWDVEQYDRADLQYDNQRIASVRLDGTDVLSITMLREASMDDFRLIQRAVGDTVTIK